jgi:hypothetical protein
MRLGFSAATDEMLGDTSPTMSFGQIAIQR